MAFKKLIWHFYVAVAFHRLPHSGRVLGASLQQFPPRPLPLPLEGPAQDSRESGRAWGEPGASFRARRGWPLAESGQGTRGRRGTTREPPPPGIPPAAGTKIRKAVLPPPSPHPLLTCHRSGRVPRRAHLPSGNLTQLASSSPRAPPRNGPFDSSQCLFFTGLGRDYMPLQRWL